MLLNPKEQRTSTVQLVCDVHRVPSQMILIENEENKNDILKIIFLQYLKHLIEVNKEKNGLIN